MERLPSPPPEPASRPDRPREIRPVHGERRGSPRGPVHVLGDPLYSALRWIERHVRGFFSAITVFLLLGVIVAGAAAVVFAALGRLVRAGATGAFDQWVLERVAAYRTPGLTEAFLELTTLGNTSVLVVVVGVASVFLWLTRHRYSVYLLLIAVIGQHFINSLLKSFYGRPRPIVVPMLDRVSSASFPSGHAMSAMVAYASVAYLVARLEPRPLLRRTTAAIAALLIVAIGASRVYLGVHYPSDVLGGYLAGLAWVAIVITGMAAIRFLARRRPEIERQEKDLHAGHGRARGRRR